MFRAKAALLLGSLLGSLLVALGVTGLGACSGAGTSRAAPGHEASDGTSGSASPDQDARMAWWRDARFGMFIHWGLYAIPAGTWPEGAADANHDHAEWIRESAKIPVGEYEKLQARFDPVKFDAELWAKSAAEAGMKYLVITSKHHDGFCLFDSKWTDWDVGGTPFKRDILKELSAACTRHGIRFCTYHSIMDWHHPDYLPRRGWEKEARPEGNADYAKFEEYLHHQVEEVVTRYHPGVMWFDGEWEPTWNHERGLRLFELCRKLDPTMIVNNRVDVHRGGMGGFSESKDAVGDFATPEQEIPATGVPGLDWETCMTMNEHWGFNATDEKWKSAEDLVRKLADIASKGGNFLLNVGPRADGTFPPEAVKRLSEIGAWMKVNGESIWGTTASPFDSLAFGRCTAKTDAKEGGTSKLYLHVFDWPKNQRLVLPGLGNEPVRAYTLANPAKTLPATRQESDVWVAVPDVAPDPIDSVVVLEIRGAPIVYKAPKIEAASDIFVKPLEVKMVASAKNLEIRYTTDGTEPSGSSPIYSKPIQLTTTTTVRARAFHGGAVVSGEESARFEKVEPLPSHDRPHPTQVNGTTAPLEEGVNCDIYFGDWDRLPDFDKTNPSVAPTARTQQIGLDFLKGGRWLPNQNLERLALRYWGFLKVGEPDVYVFQLSSDDGSRLWIDGKLVVDNDGLHSTEAKRGRVALDKGIHDLVVGWFNKSGGSELALSSGHLGTDLQPTKTWLEHEKGMRR